MTLEFKNINIESDYDLCVQSRRDAYYCSFNTYDGFSDFISGYREKLSHRLGMQEWFCKHVWFNDCIAGQLGFRSTSPEKILGMCI